MPYEFDKNRPIYQQLIELLTGEIIRGTRKPGDKLPSVREFAADTGVNANTAQRVYKEMETMGITETRRGQGSFVTEDAERLAALREETKAALVQSFMKDLEAYGFSRAEILEVVRRETN